MARHHRTAWDHPSALTIASCVAALAWAAAAPAQAPPAGAAPAGPRLLVTPVAPVKKTLTRIVEQPGEIRPLEETAIVAKVPGYVDRVAVDIGDRVKRGDVLVQLRAPELLEDLRLQELRIEQAAATVKQAESAVQAAQAALGSARARKAEAEAAVVEATAAHEAARVELARYQALFDAQAIQEARLDESRAQEQAARAAVQQAQARRDSVSADIRQAEAEVHKAEADRAAAEVAARAAAIERDRARAMTEYLTLTAPYDGFVTGRAVDPGQFVGGAAAAAARPLLTVVRVERVRVVVNVPELDAGYVSAGDPATVRVQALDNASFPSEVTRAAVALDPDSRTLRTEIELDNAELRLKPGLYVRVAITVAERKEALVVPTAALFPVDGKVACHVVEQGRIARRFVEPGLAAAGETEILSGLAGGEAVVGKNPTAYQPGQEVDLPPPAQP